MKELLQIKKNGKYVHKANDIAEHFNITHQAVYYSRKKDDKLDKLYVYDLLCKKTEKPNIEIIGDIKKIEKTVNEILSKDTKYRVQIEKANNG